MNLKGKWILVRRAGGFVEQTCCTIERDVTRTGDRRTHVDLQERYATA